MLFAKAIVEGRADRRLQRGQNAARLHLHRRHRRGRRARSRTAAGRGRGQRAVRDLQHRQPRGGRISIRSSRRSNACSGVARSGTIGRCSRATCPRRTRRSSGCSARPVLRRIRRWPTVSRASSPGIATTASAKRASAADAKLVAVKIAGRALPHFMIIVTGGAGFIGANFILDWFAARRRAGRQSRQADVRRQPAAAWRRSPAMRGIGSCAPTSATRTRSARCSTQQRPRAIVNFAAETHVDRSIRGPAAFIETNVVGNLFAARSHPRVVDTAPVRRARRIPVPARVDRRGLRLAPAERSGVLRNDAVRAEQSLRGIEGVVRSSRARVPPYLRTADADDPLLEQLRSAAVSREADSA